MAHHTIQPVPVRPWQEWSLAAALLALAVASSWIGIHNGFTYDDVFIVENNKLVADLGNWWKSFTQPYWPVQWGADGYRPLTMIAFTLEWAAGGGKPWVFHATNIALYAAISMMVFFLARTCLPLAGAWVAAALFAVHPLHVEAVANVVGQAELLVALFVIPAVTIYVRARNANELTAARMVVIGILYVLACLSKEHGIVLPALLLAAELTIIVDKAPIRERFVRVRPFVLSLVALAAAYLWAHTLVSSEVATGFHEYVPFSTNNVGTGGRLWTMFGLVPDWIRLFMWPARLSTEYGPPAYPVVTEFAPYQLPGMLILAAVLALIVIGRKRSPTVSFGLAFAFVALLPTSNFIVASGILLAERTLFLPSVGVMIAVGAAVPWAYRHLRIAPLYAAAAAAFVMLLGLGTWKSHNRTQVWKDNDTLFNAGVHDQPNVYRTHYMLGAWKFHLKRKVEGERSYQRAMELYDRDPYVFYSLGQEYLTAGMYRSAVPLFRKTLEVDSNVVEARARLALALIELGQGEEAEKEALLALKQNTRSGPAMRVILKAVAQKRREAAAAGPPAGDSASGPPLAIR
ncbi:MAG TPA: tetratricopeptide repeat protein [Gemmatimonadaceae bacterium]|nr:tetratricopeptide repeat protein [Gemmatimonadaceae bacterium]